MYVENVANMYYLGTANVIKWAQKTIIYLYF